VIGDDPILIRKRCCTMHSLASRVGNSSKQEEKKLVESFRKYKYGGSRGGGRTNRSQEQPEQTNFEHGGK